MKKKIKIVLLFYFCTLLPVSLFETYVYAKKEIDTYAEVLINTNKQEIVKGEKQKPNGLVKLPKLNGIWTLKKTTLKRRIDPVLIKPVVLTHCNRRLPFEKRDFIKEVVIFSPKEDFYTVRTLYPVTNDIYYDPNQDKDITYDNFGFKAAIDPRDITYAYTLKLKDQFENPSLSRQLWLNGRLKYEKISRNKVIARGYEIESTPECEGFILDEILFEFDKRRDIDTAVKTEPQIVAKNIPQDIKYSALYKQDISKIDTAKPTTEFKPGLFYKQLDSVNTKVPGLD